MEQITREEMIGLLSRVEAAMEFPYQDPMILQYVRKAKAALRAAEPVAEVVHNSVGVDIAWCDPPSSGRPPVGTKLFTLPCPPAKVLVPINNAIEAMSSDPEFVRGLEEGRQRISEAKVQVPMFRSSADGEHWPRIGGKYLVKLNGVLQEEIFEFDQGDDGAFSGGEYFWSRDDLDECPAFNADADEWLPLSALLSTPKAQVPEVCYEIADCPIIWEQATIPKVGFDPDNPQHRRQVVGTLHISYDKWDHLQKLTASPAPDHSGDGNEMVGLLEWIASGKTAAGCYSSCEELGVIKDRVISFLAQRQQEEAEANDGNN